MNNWHDRLNIAFHTLVKNLIKKQLHGAVFFIFCIGIIMVSIFFIDFLILIKNPRFYTVCIFENSI